MYICVHMKNHFHLLFLKQKAGVTKWLHLIQWEAGRKSPSAPAQLQGFLQKPLGDVKVLL